MAQGSKSKYWHLSQFSLSKRLKRRELIYLCDHSVMKSYHKGDQFEFNDTENNCLFFLKNGAVKLEKIREDGLPYLDTVIGQGSLFGLSTINSEIIQSTERAICLKKTKVCKVPYSILEELMEKNRSLHNYLLKLAGLKIKKLEYRLENLIFKTSEQRIREFFPKFIQEFGEDHGPYYKMELYLTNKDIGSLTNTTRQKVNQVMNQMKREGKLSFTRKFIAWYK